MSRSARQADHLAHDRGRGQPRWSADRPLAERITRVGRFQAIDPAVPGRVWSRWNWVGSALWAGVVGGTLARAHRHHGGLPPPQP